MTDRPSTDGTASPSRDGRPEPDPLRGSWTSKTWTAVVGLAVLLILLGWAVSFGLVGLYLYTGAIAIAFHLRVVLGEEPWLARTHGATWQEYVRRVPRWFW